MSLTKKESVNSPDARGDLEQEKGITNKGMNSSSFPAPGSGKGENMSTELWGVAIGAGAGLAVQLVQLVLVESRERLRKKQALLKGQLEKACATAIIRYKEEELLIERLAACESKGKQAIKRDVHRQAAGESATILMERPSRIKETYYNLTDLQVPAYLKEIKPSDDIGDEEWGGQS